MVLKHIMVWKKKHILIVLLLFIYSILIAQETLFNQVLCYKNNGSFDLELAFCGFKCECEHNHSKHHKTKNGNQLFSENECCFDVPIGNSLLERVLSFKITYFNIIKLHNLSDELICYPINQTIQYRSFFDLLPLSKFMNSFLFHINKVIIQC